MNLKYLFFRENWNIGFSEISVNEFFLEKKLSIKWMKHNYNDRFFADPFILSQNENEIELLAEEYIFDNKKGCIVKLSVDKKSKRLKNRKEILKLDTHLSYPAIIEINGEVFIYPENGQSGKLNLYRFNRDNSTITFEKTLVNEPLTDATITYINGEYFLFTTKRPKTHSELYVYLSNQFDGVYEPINIKPVIQNESCARPAGNIIQLNKKFYRVGQDCRKRYGAGVVVQEITKIDKSGFSVIDLFRIYPKSFKYNLGLHTINFQDNLCVVDGYGYLHPVLGRFHNFMHNLKCKLFARDGH